MKTIKFTFNKKKNSAFVEFELLSMLKNHFSVENKAAKFSQSRFIPKRKYVITDTGAFDEGLYFTFLEYLRTNNIKVNVEMDEEFQNRNCSVFEPWNVEELNIPLRDYQKDILDQAMSFGRGTVVLATAGGKTLVSATLIHNLVKRLKNNKNQKLKTVMIVPNLGLVEQTYDEFIKFGLPQRVTKWTGSYELDLTADVIICNMSILTSKSQDVSWMSDIDILIVDECHKVKKENEINKIIKKITTPYRFAFTGTLPDDDYSKWNIIGKFGRVIYERKAHQLRDANYVAKSKIIRCDLTYKNTPNYGSFDNPSENYRIETEFLETNSFRNNVICRFAKKFDQNSLILVEHIAHGEFLLKFLKENTDKEVFFIQGEMDVEERKRIQALMETQSNVCCVAMSTIFSTGISINNLHYIIFGLIGKSMTKVVQSIGRGLRLHEQKSQLVIIDLADSVKYASEHAGERMRYYKQEKIDVVVKDIIES